MVAIYTSHRFSSNKYQNEAELVGNLINLWKKTSRNIARNIRGASRSSEVMVVDHLLVGGIWVDAGFHDLRITT